MYEFMDMETTSQKACLVGYIGGTRNLVIIPPEVGTSHIYTFQSSRLFWQLEKGANKS